MILLKTCFQYINTSANTNTNLLDKSGIECWKSWLSKFGTERAKHHISGLTDDYEIASKLADHIVNLCSTSNSKRSSALLEESTAARKDYVGFPITDSMLPNVELVDSVISDLKNGKAEGLDGLTDEHLKFSHPALALVLVTLFNLILCQCMSIHLTSHTSNVLTNT